MGPLPYMQSFVDQDVVTRCIPVPVNADRRERERNYLMMPPTAVVTYRRYTKERNVLHSATGAIVTVVCFCFLWRCGPTRAMTSSFLRFLDHTQRRTTVGRTPLDEWSARRRDLYLTTHNTHNRQTSMPSVGFEPTISAGERPQTYAVDRAPTGTGDCDGGRMK